MRLLLLVLALAFVPVAGAASVPTPALDAVASEVAGKSVSVWCEESWPDWNSMTVSAGRSPWVGGYTFFAQPVVYLRPDSCVTLRVALTQGVPTVGSYWFAGALLTLAHESVHQRGERDEQVTDCVALSLVGSLATKHFGVSPTVTEMRKKRVSRTIVRRVHGVTVRVKVWDVLTVPISLPNPVLAQLSVWAAAWHGVFGPPC